ncbi:LADA_0H05138g1_1 [Lachancea dasiensis]|uniref:N-acetylglucosaminylphosphatidylinositol deacetylase n=1 Tax=Lachancea dasiensis TaxID=1072105 RepID=A0A1G4K127_9SACH|nr:LADA_0H05138g1_1 [Lachancea dasiensis]
MLRLFKAWYLVLILCAWYIGVSSRLEICNNNVFERMFMGHGVVTSLNLVIAHPDDEVMFFAPTLLQLDQRLGHKIPVRIFSLTDGGADGLGEVRTQELRECAKLLLRRKQPKVFVLNFDDGMDEVWDLEKAASEVAAQVPDRNPIFITFDDKGVSQHVNHISCYKAVQILKHKIPNGLFFRLLSKTLLPEKYSAFLPALLRSFTCNEKLVFVNSFSHYLLAFASMLNAHVSQMVWFRYGWWLFSCYVYVNELQAI